MRKHKRCYLRIVADILSILTSRKNVRKTHIMYGANLSYTLLNRYLNDILIANLISQNHEGYYKITNKGMTFLDIYESYVKKKEQVEEKIAEMKSKRGELQHLLSSQSP